jgi:cell division protein FtsZ
MLADEGIHELGKCVDSLITIPNEKLLSVLGKGVTLIDAFKAANDVLLGAVQGIAELITRPGMINVDFADVRTVMSEMGMAMMGSGIATGQDRACEAAKAAVSSPLLEDIDIAGAKGILVNVTSGMDLSIGDFNEVGTIVQEFASSDATIVIGTVLDPEMSDELRVTVVATGLDSGVEVEAEQPAVAKEQPVASLVDNLSTRGSTHIALSRKKRAAAATAGAASLARVDDLDMEMLDIPAFLRKQAD